MKEIEGPAGASATRPAPISTILPMDKGAASAAADARGAVGRLEAVSVDVLLHNY